MPLFSYHIATTMNARARGFFKEHVATRKPAVFCRKEIDLENIIYKVWSNQELRERSGEDTIRCEIRDDVNTGGYGRGLEMELSFNQFLDRIESGDESIYLTTQELQYTLEDEPLLLSSPVCGLRQDFSMSPELMGNLVLQNVNLWMGNSTQPSTSGLHHDYHDNLYVLLRGRKTFHLYSYEDIDSLYPAGEVCVS